VIIIAARVNRTFTKVPINDQNFLYFIVVPKKGGEIDGLFSFSEYVEADCAYDAGYGDCCYDGSFCRDERR